MLSVEAFKSVFPRAKDPASWVQELSLYLPRYDVNTYFREAAFLSQCGHESAGFTALRENLNYSAKALQTVFRKYFPNPQIATDYERKPERIANRIYSNRMGNGPEGSGDGWRYRGRGLIQLTGRNNYNAFSQFIAEPEVLRNPDIVAEPKFALLSAIWFWKANNLNAYADRADLIGLTRAINGGTNGLDDRVKLYHTILNAMG